jgi:hypothetical protein
LEGQLGRDTSHEENGREEGEGGELHSESRIPRVTRKRGVLGGAKLGGEKNSNEQGGNYQPWLFTGS